MEEYLKVLDINDIDKIDKNLLKETYYGKIKEFPPENNSEMFITITNAYDYLEKYIENKNDKYREIINEIINGNEKLNERDIKERINKKLSGITIDNFQYENANIIKSILKLKKNGFLAQALMIACLSEYAFKKIGLEKLSNSYRELERSIINN